MFFRSPQSWLMPVVSQLFLSRSRLLKLRKKAEEKRQSSRRPHLIHFFHQADDPYSQLLMKVLPILQSRYNISIETHLVGPPESSAVPERDLLKAYSLLDSQRLAKRFQLDWRFEQPMESPNSGTVSESQALRKKWGHYLGATLYYEGEWYWGIDRLHHLEDRLKDLGLCQTKDTAPLFPKMQYAPFDLAPQGTSIDFFFSFRSPYSAISAAKIFHWAHQAGIRIKLRYVLPMVMRGLPVPAEKRRYISLDAAREAHVQGVPFGRLNDPVGKPTERGLALMPFAEMHSLAEDYVMSFMKGVWSEGLDAGLDAHLQIIVERAGLNWTAAKNILRSQSNEAQWRAIAEENRQALFALGLWGVPSFRYQNTAAWGQDRFWVIEDALRAQFGACPHDLP
jgi:2-hydroxychromene-2-carboxylate isomerase